MRAETLELKNFGPIRHARIRFADITVLVGPQATGKSLVCQWLKLLKDRGRIAHTLSRYGYEIDRDEAKLLSLYFGAGYRSAWRPSSSVKLGGSSYTPNSIAKMIRRREGVSEVLYLPAHRAMVVTTGYPSGFRAFRPDTPFVVREFSERLLEFFNGIEAVFPIKGRLREEYRKKLDASIFHSGEVAVVAADTGERSLRLKHADSQLSIMEWTTGQREVLPLIAGLYDALPSGHKNKHDGMDWVVVEELELGLHPNAIVAVMILLLDVVRRGYRLVITTHSPLVLDILWAIRQLRNSQDSTKGVLKLLELRSNPLTKVLAESALESDLSVAYLDFVDGKVDSQDITSLDPFATDQATAGWGGLLEHNSRISDVVSEVGE